MSFNTTAAACQNVMNASIAVEAINTRGALAGAASDRDFIDSLTLYPHDLMSEFSKPRR